jgi:hypothetical protein
MRFCPVFSQVCGQKHFWSYIKFITLNFVSDSPAVKELKSYITATLTEQVNQVSLFGLADMIRGGLLEN